MVLTSVYTRFFGDMFWSDKLIRALLDDRSLGPKLVVFWLVLVGAHFGPPTRIGEESAQRFLSYPRLPALKNNKGPPGLWVAASLGWVL